MAIQEPSSDLGLWPRVRAITGWPESNEDLLHELAEGWRRTGTRFAEAARYDVSGLTAGWPDSAGTAFQARVGQHLRTAAVTGSEMAELARRADVFATEVTSAKSQIVSLIEANLPRFADIVADQPSAAQDQFVNEVAALVRGVLSDAAGRIAGAKGGALGRAGGPPPGATPAEVNQWWEALLPEQRAAMLRESPDLIRNLDGIPAAVRDEANRAVLQREIDALTARENDLTDQLWRGHDLNGAAARELAEVKSKLAGLRDIQRAVAAGGPAGREPMLLGLDTAGDGRAIVSLGNPDTARNVATLVPGVGASLGSIKGELDRANLLWDAAARAGSPSTAVVAWVGYDAPDTVLPAAASESYAEAGKGALDSFQDGLRVTHQGAPSLNTVVGHSYGTTTIGHTARDLGLAADRVVLTASPGTGAGHASELRLDGVSPERVGQRIYATTAPDDPIRLANARVNVNNQILDTPPGMIDEPPPHLVDVGHDIDPTLPEFGARTFPTHSDSPYPHSAPFDAGSQSLDTIGQIIAGKR